MPAATFDTLKFANTLKAAGVPAQQAEAQATAFAEVIQLNLKDLATKEDLDRVAKAAKADLDQAVKELRSEIRDESAKLKLDITQLRGEMTLMKWMMGVLITLCTGIAVRLFFFR